MPLPNDPSNQPDWTPEGDEFSTLSPQEMALRPRKKGSVLASDGIEVEFDGGSRRMRLLYPPNAETGQRAWKEGQMPNGWQDYMPEVVEGTSADIQRAEREAQERYRMRLEQRREALRSGPGSRVTTTDSMYDSRVFCEGCGQESPLRVQTPGGKWLGVDCCLVGGSEDASEPVEVVEVEYKSRRKVKADG